VAFLFICQTVWAEVVLKTRGGHWALVLDVYVSPKIGIFKKNGAKNLNFFTFTIGYEQ
jgi:hypothetical protein